MIAFLSDAEIQRRLDLARQHWEQGRFAMAATTVRPLLDDRRSRLTAAQLYAAAAAADGRPDEALPYAREVVAANPRDFNALIRLLALLDRLGFYDEVEREAALSFSRGGRGPTLRLLYARSLSGLGRLDEAEAQLRLTVTEAPDFVEAHQGLANMIWSRKGDLDAALVELDAAIAKTGGVTTMMVLKAEVLSYAGRRQAAYDVLAEALARPGADPSLHFAAGQMALPLDADLCAHHVEAAKAFAGEVESTLIGLCEARLAQGRAADAEVEADKLLKLSPLNQNFIAMKATAERLQGKPGWGALYDYDRLVAAYALEPPPGWSDMAAFLSDLGVALTRLHTTETHPIGQSVREGTQTTQNLLMSEEPAIRGLFRALDAPIRRHIAKMGRGPDPLRSRNLGGYAYSGAWSVRLRAGGGSHADHVHPQGWLSSACYIEVPQAVRGDDRAGWITFGHPGTPTRPELPAEHFVRPEPGRLVLFPSYMWHGVNRFEGDQPRLTVAFDLVPAKDTPRFK